MSKSHLPSKKAALVFHAKAIALRARRSGRDALRPIQRHSKPDTNPLHTNNKRLLAESITPLFTDPSEAEWRLQLGKIENLRLCASAFNGVIVPGNEILSFWKQLGPPWTSRGFVEGREVREGCIIPTIAGGICQLSNALYDCALKAGMTIHERHGHTAEVPGSATVAGRDATVFWNYVDLRFSHTEAFQIEVQLTATEHIVRFWAVSPTDAAASPANVQTQASKTQTNPIASANSCETCGMTSCFRNQELFRAPVKTALLTTVLLDEHWPEFDTWLTQEKLVEPTRKWAFRMALNGQRRHKAAYAWDTRTVVDIQDCPVFVSYRSLASRLGSKTPAARQARGLKLDRLLATRLAKRIPYTSSHLIVTQSLLPWLYALGMLGGRTYDVLMTRTPLAQLIDTLDTAAGHYPNSPTLGDFRCDATLVELEAKALAGASRWITPHLGISVMAPKGVSVQQLDWQMPNTIDVSSREHTEKTKPLVGLIGPTLGRKGAYLLRDLVTRNADRYQWVALGETLETPDFWADLPVTVVTGALAPQHPVWTELDIAIEPAWVEHRPRLALMALSKNLPVIASPACGLSPSEQVQVLDSITVQDWETAIEATLAKVKPAAQSSTESTMTAGPCNG